MVTAVNQQYIPDKHISYNRTDIKIDLLSLTKQSSIAFAIAIGSIIHLGQQYDTHIS